MPTEDLHRNQLKSLLGIETMTIGLIPCDSQYRNQLKSLLGIETLRKLVTLNKSLSQSTKIPIRD